MGSTYAHWVYIKFVGFLIKSQLKNGPEICRLDREALAEHMRRHRYAELPGKVRVKGDVKIPYTMNLTIMPHRLAVEDEDQLQIIIKKQLKNGL